MEPESNNTPDKPADQPPVKKKGNPNFVKGQKNKYYDNSTNNTKMAEEATTVENTTDTKSTDTGAEKKSIPNDIFSDVIPEQPILPLDGEVVQKDYAQLKDEVPNNNGTGANRSQFDPVGNGTGPTSSVPPTSDPSATGPIGPTPIPGKTHEEIKTEASQAVDLMLKGYSKAHDLGRYLAKKDEQALAAEHVKGKINLNLEFPLAKGPTSIRQLVHDYNTSIDEVIVVDDEFEANVRPKLERIAIKRGWGLSDELSVLAYLVEDLATKSGLLFGLNKSMKMILEIGIENAKQTNAKNNPPPEPKNTTETTDTTGADHWRESGGIQDAEVVR